MSADQQQLEELFRVTEGGYVFRAPMAWPFKPAKHYFVTEVQKVQIQNTLKISLWKIVAWIAIVGIPAGGAPLLFLSSHRQSNASDMAITVATVIVAALLGLFLIGPWQIYRLKPILPKLRQTDERISYRELVAAARNSTTAKTYARNCMLFGINFGIVMLNAGMQVNVAVTKGNYTSLVLFGLAAVCFGFSLVQNGRLAMRKAEETCGSHVDTNAKSHG
jgi:hypothetical protein